MCVYIHVYVPKQTNMQSVTIRSLIVKNDKTAPRDPADAARTEGARSHCRPAETDRAAAARQ